MILVLSDGGAATAEVTAQLDIRDEKSIVFFTDLLSAGTYGKGSAIVGNADIGTLADVIRKNRIDAVIDAVRESGAELTRAAVSACRAAGIRYVKCAGIEPAEGTRLCLPYERVAENVINCQGNAVFYAAASTVRAIAALAGTAGAEKMYVPVMRTAVFDVAAALEYGIPLLNVAERESINGANSIREFAEEIGAELIVCDGTEGVSDAAAVGCAAGIPVLLTHRFGAGLPYVAATARDAVIEARNIGTGE